MDLSIIDLSKSWFLIWYFLQRLQHDRVDRAADKVQGGVQPVLLEVPPTAPSPSKHLPASGRPRRPAEEDGARQQPVQGTEHNHNESHCRFPAHIRVGANARSLVTSEPQMNATPSPVASVVEVPWLLRAKWYKADVIEVRHKTGPAG